MTVNAYDASSDRTNEYPYLEQIHGEDPARFLETNELTATGRIGGIRDPAILEAYEYVATQITVGQYRTTILEAIEERKADLGISDELTEDPTPDATADPVAATDGGTELEYDESDSPAEPKGSDADEIHPDCKGLEAGQVARIDRDGSTEFVWPATAACEEPYLLRAFDAEGDERTDEPIGLSKDEYRTRMDFDRDTMAVGLTDKQAPTLAATDGGSE